MDDSSDDEGIGQTEREFGQMVARRLTAMDTETREMVGNEGHTVFDTND